MSLSNLDKKSIVEAHVKRAEQEHPVWDKHRALYRCENWGETSRTVGLSNVETEDEVFFESGSLYAYVDTMVASVVPLNPQVNVRARRAGQDKVAQYRQELVNYILKLCESHSILWKLSTFASVNPRGILKAVWNYKLNRPDFRVLDPKFFFYDITADRWDDIKYACEVSMLTQAEFESRVNRGVRASRKDKRKQYNKEIADKVRGDKYPKWLGNSESGENSLNARTRDIFKWVTVYEFYDFTSPGGLYSHFAEQGGNVIEMPLYEGGRPYLFLKNPFYLHTFTDSLEDSGGMSDASIVENPVRRRDELNTLVLRYMHTSIPIPLVNEKKLDDPEAFHDQYANARSPGDIVRASLKGDATWDQAIQWSTTPDVSPAFKQFDELLDSEIQYRLGMPQYARGEAGASDVATELALIDKALNTRQGKRVKNLFSVIRFMAKAIIQLYEEFMPQDSSIPVRLADSNFMEIARADLAARSVKQGSAKLDSGEEPGDPIELDYEVIPSSPVENSDQAQLQKLMENREWMLADPLIDQVKLRKRYMKLLGEDIGLVKEAPPPVPGMPPGLPPGMPGQAPPPGLPPNADAAALLSKATQGGESPIPKGDQINPIPNGAMPALLGGPGIG